MAADPNRKYKSKRLAGFEGGWSDVEFLLYIKDKVDFRAKFPDLKEVSDKRISEIIKKLVQYEASQSIQ